MTNSKFSGPSVTMRVTLPKSTSLPLQKAKRAPKGQSTKGRHIHVCDFFGNGSVCGKVYSRAEHLRRHQLSHSKTFYVCNIPNCGREFHRLDLVTRHAARHESHGDAAPDGLSLWATTTHSRNGSIGSGSPSTSSDSELDHVLATQMFGNTDDSTEHEIMQHSLIWWSSLFIPDDYADLFPGMRHWWLNTIPRLISTSRAVKDIALSLASAHLGMVRSDTTMQRRSTSYFLRAMGVYRDNINELKSGWLFIQNHEIEALLALSLLLCVRSQVTVIEQEQPQGDVNEQIFADILLWLNCCQDYTTVTMLISALSENTDFWCATIQGVIETGFGFVPSQLNIGPEIDYARYFPSLLEGAELEVKDLGELESYWTMVRVTEWIYHQYLEERPIASIVNAWHAAVHTIPPDFLKLLSQRRPRALAILAHFLCLEKVACKNGVWWMTGNLGARIQALADIVPNDWAWALQRPLAVFLDEIDVRELQRWTAAGRDEPFSEEDEVEVSLAPSAGIRL